MPSNNGGTKNSQPITRVKPIKPCKNCPKQRYATTSLCYTHWRTHEREKRAKKKEALLQRKARFKEKKANSPKRLKKKLDDIISLYVRRRASDWRGNALCITCGVEKPYKELHAGHYVPRDNYSVRYDLRNLAPQCFKCNMKLPGCKAGNITQYTKYLVSQYGWPWVEKLIKDGEQSRQWTPEELRQEIVRYQELLKTL